MGYKTALKAFAYSEEIVDVWFIELINILVSPKTQHQG